MKHSLPQDFYFVATSPPIVRIPGIEQMLGLPVSGKLRAVDHCAGILAWGRKPSAARAEALAHKNGLPLFRIEDGFLRSVGLGHEDPPLSLVYDDLGIYYDARTASRLEYLIAAPLDESRERRAVELASAWRSGRVSKYNSAREVSSSLDQPFVLVADQTFGDASIACGLADAKSFHRMLEAALDENPTLPVVLKVHPDVLAGKKRGYFSDLTPGQRVRVTLLASEAHSPSLLEHAHSVYTVTSQIGFEGLLWGKPVRTFGMPFYAGWGLTGDEVAAPARRRKVGLANLVHGALIAYPRYLDPETRLRCEPERLLEWMALQRRMRSRFPEELCAMDFSGWKKPIVRDFFQGSKVTFSDSATPAPSPQLVWGMKDAAGSNVQTIRIEDGFLRSVGLGADLIRPLSWVIDGRGIYYDATRPSDLEHLLQNGDFDSAMLERAAALRARIGAAGLTKYNVGSGRWCRPAHAARVILVPGQVESDASLAYGAPGLRRNIDLLQRVRAANPDAYVVYKPHPDVVAGLRMTGEGEESAARWCNEIIVDIPMGDMLNLVDEVHVLTSLAGFEALLRGKKVVTYGQPFYAGWGLTTDQCPPDRRTRLRSLDELVAACLIAYPTYVSNRTGRYTTPENALDELLAWRAHGPGKPTLWLQMKRVFLRLFVGIR